MSTSRAYEARVGRTDVWRLVLEEHPEGTYIFVFRKPQSTWPEEDHLQDDVETAMRVCAKDYDVPREAWKEIACPGLR